MIGIGSDYLQWKIKPWPYKYCVVTFGNIYEKNMYLLVSLYVGSWLTAEPVQGGTPFSPKQAGVASSLLYPEQD